MYLLDAEIETLVSIPTIVNPRGTKLTEFNDHLRLKTIQGQKWFEVIGWLFFKEHYRVGFSHSPMEDVPVQIGDSFTGCFLFA